jgi:uncharacterized OB-fold protein
MNTLGEQAPGKIYREYLAAGKLGFQRCEECNEAVFHPRVLCPVCGSTSLKWEESGGCGTVYASTTIYRRNGESYNVALINLDEGFRMMSRVERVSAEEVVIGAKVHLKVSPTVDEEEEPVAIFVQEGEA